jgi:hypothetical protein
MARPEKRRIEGGKPVSTGGRTTPKKTAPKASTTTSSAPNASSRYTPPTPSSQYMPSSIWVPIVMFTFFGAGLLCIFLNYTETLPHSPSGWYLLGGLGSILAGIITSTQLR